MRYQPYDLNELAQRVRDFVDTKRNYRRFSLTSAITAEELGIARSTLIKVMREGMDTTFSEYLDKCRVMHARHFVVTNHGRQSLEHIALLCGFRTVATLRRKYKERYGELPQHTKGFEE